MKAKGPSRSPPRKLTTDDLEASKLRISNDVNGDEDRIKWELAKAIIAHYLSYDWVTKYFSPDHKSPKLDDYFRLDFSLDIEGQQHKYARVINLAETLFNLQDIEGFDERCDLLLAGQIESTVAEFDFGRFLYMHDVDFKFVTTSGKRGEDYDCLITYDDGVTACADAKCRLESSAVDPEMIKHALDKARRKNLPPDQAGIIFVKLPQTWLESADVRQGVFDTAKDWIRGTERVVLVVLYCYVEFFHKQLQMTVHRHLVDEVQSERHRFDMAKNWKLFESYRIPKDWAGMPPKWHRIFSTGRLA